jgi:hypothetical protein
VKKEKVKMGRKRWFLERKRLRWKRSEHREMIIEKRKD